MDVVAPLCSAVISTHLVNLIVYKLPDSQCKLFCDIDLHHFDPLGSSDSWRHCIECAVVLWGAIMLKEILYK